MVASWEIFLGWLVLEVVVVYVVLVVQMQVLMVAVREVVLVGGGDVGGVTVVNTMLVRGWWR